MKPKMEVKRCTGKFGCEKLLPVDSFDIIKKHYKGELRISYNTFCKSCSIWQWYWKKYKITKDIFLNMFSSQRGLCAICKINKPVGKYNKWHIDHNHDTGKIRGILCHICNSIRVLGVEHLLKDALFEKVVSYIDNPVYPLSNYKQTCI